MALLLCHVRSSIDDSRVLVQWAELLLLKEVGDLGPGTPALALRGIRDGCTSVLSDALN